MTSDQGPELMFQYDGSASALADDIDDDDTKRPGKRLLYFIWGCDGFDTSFLCGALTGQDDPWYTDKSIR